MDARLILRNEVFLGRLLKHHPDHFASPRDVKPEAEGIAPAPVHVPKVEVSYRFQSIFWGAANGGEKVAKDEPDKTLMQTIIKEVCAFYEVRPIDITSNRRTMNLTRPRQAAAYLGRQMTGLSYPQIGAALGGRDHTTIIYSVRRTERRLANNDRLRDELEILRLRIAEKSGPYLQKQEARAA